MKYHHLHQAVLEKLANESWGEQVEFFQPTSLSVDEVKRVHSEEYVDLLVAGAMPAAKMRRIGFRGVKL